MIKYTIDLLNIDGERSAVIMDRVGVGKNNSAGEAVDAAIDEAEITERKFAHQAFTFQEQSCL